jgi:NAD(P)-dependent dehydrogenase (short-subunit alcohol dehydrogenase family)
VNHLGHFYLTQLLLPLLRSSAPSRVINVSSTAAWNPSVPLPPVLPPVEQGYAPFQYAAPIPRNVPMHAHTEHHFPCRNYHYSKLANVLFTQEFNARTYTPGGVTAYVLHPGVIDTGLGRHGGITNFLLYRVRVIFAQHACV